MYIISLFLQTLLIFMDLIVCSGSPNGMMSSSNMFSTSPLGSITPPGSKAPSFCSSPTPPGVSSPSLQSPTSSGGQQPPFSLASHLFSNPMQHHPPALSLASPFHPQLLGGGGVVGESKPAVNLHQES